MSEAHGTGANGPIVVLTGAGISKESGLDTFRDKGGIWEKVSIEEVATPEAFQANPERVQQFYNDRRRQLTQDRPEPNAGHTALARLAREWPGEVLVVTQNIDDLHERAGQDNLIHMHGELRKARCTDCAAVVAWDDDLAPATGCPHCDTGTLRPHVVWFGEMPFQMERIFDALQRCGLFISVGTSGSVYPAAGFVQEVLRGGRARTVELNLEPSDGSVLFHESRHGPASEVVPAFVDDLLAGRIEL
ncbi:NAD-dependent protein deacylase [Rhodovibrio sodomensis]|uniref:NAD-dependent protein deacylase n=1 Tax=Rhodovibrio sodomensis TaxID=1088 RepID=A0ABS1DDQ3_9PROT|nr:NAD-dependent deacylase [Rhodovibrio sodomensis]MBK1668014.1 NAD-dependent protein deacylase [Rhodovibrio sodomensis]